MREFITAAKAVRDIFTELEREIEEGGAVAHILCSKDDLEDDDIRIEHIDLNVEIDQLRVVTRIDGEGVASRRVGDLLVRFDRALAALQVPA